MSRACRREAEGTDEEEEEEDGEGDSVGEVAGEVGRDAAECRAAVAEDGTSAGLADIWSDVGTATRRFRRGVQCYTITSLTA